MVGGFRTIQAAGVLAIILAARGHDPARAGEPTPRLMVRMAQSSFVPGEPIGLSIAIDNPSPESAVFGFAPPNLPISIDTGPSGLLEAPPETPGRHGGQPTTRIPPRSRWMATIYPLLGSRRPEPGVYPLTYSFQGTYRLGDPLQGPGDADEPERLTLSARGAFTITIRPAVPGDLERILGAYRSRLNVPEPLWDRALWQIREWANTLAAAEEPQIDPRLIQTSLETAGRYLIWREGLWDPQSDAVNMDLDLLTCYLMGREGQRKDRAAEAAEALAAVRDPVVIPYLAEVLTTDHYEVGFRALEHFHGSDEARRVMVHNLKSERSPVDLMALEWLRDEGYPLAVDELRSLLRRGREKPGVVVYVLDYLKAIDRWEYHQLRPDFAAYLPDAEYALPGILDVLARWQAPPSPEVQAALRRLATAARDPRQVPASRALPVLARWRHVLDVDDLKALLMRDDLTGVGLEATLNYLRAVDRPAYHALQPQVAELLKAHSTDVVVTALDLLGRWGYRLTPAEQKALLEREDDAIRAALRDSLRKYEAH